MGYCSKIIKNGFSGLLFDPKNDFELKLQLEKITQDGYLRETMASNFKAFVTKEYSEEEVMKSLISAYKK